MSVILHSILLKPAHSMCDILVQKYLGPCGWRIFQPVTWQGCRSYHGKCADELHSLVPSSLDFTSRTRYATVANHLYPPRILSVRNKSPTLTASSREQPPGRTNSQEDVASITTFLICLSLDLTIIFHSYPYKLPINVTLPRVAPGLVQGESHWQKKNTGNEYSVNFVQS